MPFEPAPKITTNPWTERFPAQARALRDLASYVRTVPAAMWAYEAVGGCGSVGCALGHAPAVASCKPFLTSDGGMLNPYDMELPRRAQRAFFFGDFPSVRMCEVTREMVAYRIEHWLATGEIR